SRPPPRRRARRGRTAVEPRTSEPGCASRPDAERPRQARPELGLDRRLPLPGRRVALELGGQAIVEAGQLVMEVESDLGLARVVGLEIGRASCRERGWMSVADG